MTRQKQTAITPAEPPVPPAPGRAVYSIAVAVELSGVAAQSLRLYETHGLLNPARSDGGTRRYSSDDLTRIGRISALLAAGVNLTGVGHILRLEDDNQALARTNADLEDAAAHAADDSPHP